ncbi:hypothetical protein NQ318_007313 [Aromia moschata]|uniref:Uncharacterized protein n=1 Tax=Aromia moschata TaxID=1265417 RepID=A0AAV8Z129_9CUCU|nr:hypothetical protein NQ318_007313 [Aromia moschata]
MSPVKIYPLLNSKIRKMQKVEKSSREVSPRELMSRELVIKYYPKSYTKNLSFSLICLISTNLQHWISYVLHKYKCLIIHPFLGGLVAVLLYYDGRKALVTTLLYLVQARTGVQWCVKVNPDVARYITDYTNQLMEGGLFHRIFELLRTFDLSKEIEKLQQNLALGGPKHRRQVTDLFNDTKSILADILESREEASGKIDDVNLYLQMALLSALDLSILHTREDGEEAVQLLPVLSDPSYILTVINEFLPTKPKWVCEGLQALSTFGLAVCISSLRDVPQNYQFQDAINKEEAFVDAAIEMNVFMFMHNILLENKTLYKESFLFKRVHNLITDFIFFHVPKSKGFKDEG